MDIKEAAQKVISAVKSNPQMLQKLSTNAESAVKEVLKDGKLTADEIKKIAEETGVTRDTVYRIRKEVEIYK